MLTPLQQRQLAEINTEFARRGLEIRTHTSMWSSGLREVTIAFGKGCQKTNWYKDMYAIYDDIGRFGIQLSSSYMIEMLRRKGVFGVAICGPRDELNSEFGAFVARARLLKHIKTEETIEEMR